MEHAAKGEISLQPTPYRRPFNLHAEKGPSELGHKTAPMKELNPGRYMEAANRGNTMQDAKGRGRETNMIQVTAPHYADKGAKNAHSETRLAPPEQRRE